ncbi:MAG: hypothetical protein H6752_00890 [Candidatus Omnitrophica bacterium]|nr:hypothetical protein [Candidatus Omnitrophota bacterium]
MNGHHVEYHGWVTSLGARDMDVGRVENELRLEHDDWYPLVVQFVNGHLHILFSGAPNHYGGNAHDILKECLKLPEALGIVYLIDHDTGDHPHVLVLADGKISEKQDASIPYDQFWKWWKGPYSNWILEENLHPWLEIISNIVGYEFSEMDRDAFLGALPGTNSEDGRWFEYELVGRTTLPVKVARDEPGSSMIMVQVECPTDLGPQVATASEIAGSYRLGR